MLFSHKGTVGKLALAPEDAPPFVCSPQTTFWRSLDDTRLDRCFLYYFMSSRAFSEQWQARKGEGGVPLDVEIEWRSSGSSWRVDDRAQRAWRGISRYGLEDDRRL